MINWVLVFSELWFVVKVILLVGATTSFVMSSVNIVVERYFEAKFKHMSKVI
jgi:hypothetical protein